MEIITTIGLIAGILTTGSGIPQVIKTFQTKKTKDISFLMYAASWMGIFLWMIYGIYLKDTIIITFNLISLALVSTMLILKLKYK